MKSKAWKRWVSGTLAGSLLVGILPVQALALSRQEVSDIGRVWIWENGHLDEISDQEQSQGVIYIGATEAVATEDGGMYGVTVYRDGDVSKPATIDFSTVDISAEYGKDYIFINQPDTIFHQTNGTLLSQNANRDVAQEIENFTQYVQELAQAEQTSTSSDGSQSSIDADFTIEDGVYQGATDAESLEIAAQATGKSTLALRKEAETGIATRSVDTDRDASALPDPEMSEEQALEDARNNLSDAIEISTSIPLTFAAGQTEQYVVVHILDDDIAEDTELAMFLLSHPAGALLGNLSNCTMQITDNEARETAYVGFSQDAFTFTESTGEIELMRTGADYFMVATEITLLDADEQSVGSQTVTFEPYQTSANVQVDIEGQGTYTAVLTDYMACEPDNNYEASLHFSVIDDNQAATDKPSDTAENPIENSNTDTSDDTTTTEPADALFTTASSNPELLTGGLTQASRSESAQRFTLTGKAGTEGAPLEIEYVAGQQDASGNLFAYIYDTGLEPEVIVGQYYYVDSMKPSLYGQDSPTHYAHELHGSAPDSHYYLNWYNWVAWKKGGVLVRLADLNTIGISSVGADYTMTRDGGSNNDLYLEPFSSAGSVGREYGTAGQDVRAFIESSIDNSWTLVDNLLFKLEDDSGTCPLTEAKFYGFATFYSKFKVKALTSGTMTFRTEANGNTGETAKVPANIKLGVGHDTRYYQQSLQIISESAQSNSLMCGNLLGYKFEFPDYKKFNADNKTPCLYYLASDKTVSDVENEDIKADATVKHFSPGVNITNIKFDDAFIHDILEEVFPNRVSTTQINVTPLYGYKDVTVKFNDATIKKASYGFDDIDVLAGEQLHAGDRIALKATAPDGYYYAGYYYESRVTDNVNENYESGVRYVTADTAAYLELGLGGAVHYTLTPIFIQDAGNYITIKSESDDISVLNVLTDDQVDLLDDVFPNCHFSDDDYILVTDASAEPNTTVEVPDGVTVPAWKEEQARAILGQVAAIPGKVYTIYAISDKDNIMPVFHDTGNYQVGFPADGITSHTLDFIASADADNNVITVDAVQRDANATSFFQLQGELFLGKYTVRESDITEILADIPAESHTVYASGSPTYCWLTKQNSDKKVKSLLVDRRNGAVNDAGVYTISGVEGIAGDWVSLYSSNGDVEKVFYAQLSDSSTDAYQVDSIQDMSFIVQTADDSTQTNTSKTYLVDGYAMQVNRAAYLPVFSAGAPTFEKVEYSYRKSDNNVAFGNASNSVAIAADLFTVKATINPNGKEIKQMVFTIDTRQGEDFSYVVEADYKGQTTFECDLGGKQMDKVLADGDRLFLTLYDAVGTILSFPMADEAGEPILDDNGNPLYSTSEVDRVYSKVFSGLGFYVPNVKITPQEITYKNNTGMAVPLFGTVSTSTSSGKVSLSTQKWNASDPKSPFTLVFAVNGSMDSLWNSALPTAKDRYAKLLSAYDKSKNVTEDAKKVDSTDVPDENEKTDPTKLNSKAMNETFSKWRATVNLVTVAEFHMGYNEKDDAFELIGGELVFGGVVSTTKTFYATVYGVPLYLQFTGTFEIDFISNFLSEEGKEISESEFYQSENIADVLPEASTGIFSIASLKASGGVGVAGLASIRGTVQGAFQSFLNPYSKADSGFMLTLSGGFGIDLIIFTFDFVPPLGTYGYGLYENKSAFLPSIPQPNKSATYSVGGIDSSDMTSDLIFTGAREQDAGESVSGNFNSNIPHTGANANAPYVLLENAPEHARPQLLQLENGDKFLVFLANHDGIAQLHYSIFSGTSWSTPELVDGNGTIDANAALSQYGNSVFITWVDSTKKGLPNAANLPKTLSNLNISACKFDLKSETMGKTVQISDREDDMQYMDYNPILASDPDGKQGAAMLFLKKDTLAATGSDTNLLDGNHVYEALMLATWNGDKSVKEQFIPIKGDPMILNLDAVLLPNFVKGDNFLLCTYTADNDKDFTTANDQEVYLLFHNITDDVTYPPIPVTNNYIPDFGAQLTKLSDGDIHMTWMATHATDVEESETRLHSLNISEIFEEIKDKYNLKDFFEKTGKNWYKLDASDIADFDGSVFQRLKQDTLANSGTPIMIDGASVSLDDYQIVQTDDTIYLFFTAEGSIASQDFSTELYGVSYCMNNADGSDNRIGWGHPVKLTEFGKQNSDGSYPNTVLDEISVVADEDGEFTFISNMYAQNIEALPDDIAHSTSTTAGRISYSDHALVGYSINTQSNCEIFNIHVSPVLPKAGDTVTVSYDIKNTGLLPMNGYESTISVAGQDFSNRDSALSVFGGETVTVTSTATLKQAPTVNSMVTIAVDAGSSKDTAQLAIDYMPDVRFTHSELTQNENGLLQLPLTLTNYGNAPMPAFTLAISERLSHVDDGQTDSQQVSIPEIAVGETYTVTVTLDEAVLSPAHFSDYGTADIVLENIAPDDASVLGSTLTEVMSIYQSTFRAEVDVKPVEPVKPDKKPGSGASRPTPNTDVETDAEIVPQIHFEDVSADAWYADAVQFAVANGLFNGMSDTGFGPYLPMTRAMFFTVLHRYSKDTQYNTANPWYAAGTEWAMAMGISDGSNINGNITREQLVTMLYRYTGSPVVSGTLSQYSDASTVSDWAVDAFLWATQQGIISGQTPTTLVPKAGATRAEVATIMMRYVQLMQ